MKKKKTLCKQNFTIYKGDVLIVIYTNFLETSKLYA